MVSFQRQKWQVDCFFAPLNLRNFPYSFGLIYPQYQMLISTVVDFPYGSYGPNRITHPKDMKHVVISVSVVIIPPMLNAPTFLAFFLTQQLCFLVLTQFAFYKPLASRSNHIF